MGKMFVSGIFAIPAAIKGTGALLEDISTNFSNT